MSKNIREMIDKDKNFKQFVNENDNNSLKKGNEEYSYVTKSGKKIAYHDISGKLVKIGDEVEVRYNSGINQGSPNNISGIITKMDDYGNWTLDNSISIKPNDTYDYTDNLGIMHFKGFTKSHGWEFWIKKLGM
jgi:hypothetical protein